MHCLLGWGNWQLATLAEQPALAVGRAQLAALAALAAARAWVQPALASARVLDAVEFALAAAAASNLAALEEHVLAVLEEQPALAAAGRVVVLPPATLPVLQRAVLPQALLVERPAASMGVASQGATCWLGWAKLELALALMPARVMMWGRM